MNLVVGFQQGTEGTIMKIAKGAFNKTLINHTC